MKNVTKISAARIRTIDAIDQLDTKLRDIQAVSNLLAGVSEDVGMDTVKSSGFMLDRMLEDVRASLRRLAGGTKLASSHARLQDYEQAHEGKSVEECIDELGAFEVGVRRQADGTFTIEHDRRTLKGLQAHLAQLRYLEALHVAIDIDVNSS